MFFRRGTYQYNYRQKLSILLKFGEKVLELGEAFKGCRFVSKKAGRRKLEHERTG